jgi:tripeptidyl-peptidase-1
MNTLALEKALLPAISNIQCSSFERPINDYSRYHIPSHIQEHIDYITPGIKLFTPPQKATSDSDLERRIFGVTSGNKDAGLLPPLLKSLGMTLEGLLAIPELLVCSIAITPPCIAG